MTTARPTRPVHGSLCVALWGKSKSLEAGAGRVGRPTVRWGRSRLRSCGTGEGAPRVTPTGDGGSRPAVSRVGGAVGLVLAGFVSQEGWNSSLWHFQVRINTGKNTTLKFSEKKEEAKRKRKNSCGGGHPGPELPTIRTPADVYR